MRKIYLIVAFLIFITVIIALFSSRYGLKLGNVVIAPVQDKKLLEDMSFRFWEDIQFKDFKRAASYHTADVQAERDIAFFIERLFMVKPEQLDIKTIEITEVDVDSTGERGRTKAKLMVDILNTGKIKEPEAVLYWFKKDGVWKMNLESSLRPLEEDPTKRKKK
ncbi:hypothetical protein JXQ70_03440 [bacterium]|nr:hypothetical protein [bacterium]